MLSIQTCISEKLKIGHLIYLIQISTKYYILTIGVLVIERNNCMLIVCVGDIHVIMKIDH